LQGLAGKFWVIELDWNISEEAGLKRIELNFPKADKKR